MRQLLDVITHSIEDPWTVKKLNFDLTCDVISDLEVNETSFLLKFLQGYRTPFEFCKSAQ